MHAASAGRIADEDQDYALLEWTARVAPLATCVGDFDPELDE